MLKRFFIILIALLQVAAISAQSSVGGWERFSTFSGGVTRMIDTPSKVYYVSNGYLYDYDKQSDATTAYNSSTVLSDNNVVFVKYNRADKYLFIGYENGNIDLLMDNGKVVNIPDITDAVMSVDKGINNVHFENGKIYVALKFGVVIIDSKKFHVIDSGVYNKNVMAFFPMGNALMLMADNFMYAVEDGKSIRSLDNFVKLHDGSIDSHAKLSDTLLAITGSWGTSIYEYTNPLTGNYGKPFNNASMKNCGHFIETADGGVYLAYNNTLYKANIEKKNFESVQALPAATKNTVVSMNNTLASLWSGDANGIANYKIDGSNVTVLQDRFMPMNVSSVAEPVSLFSNLAGDHIYVSNRGMAMNRPGVSNYTNRAYINLIYNGDFTDVSPHGTKAYSFSNAHKDNEGGYYAVNPQTIVEDPDDPGLFYMSSGSEGVYCVRDGKIVGQFTHLNSPMNKPYGVFAYAVDIDPDGNLWVGINTAGQSSLAYAVLPKAKRLADPSTITADDWQSYIKNGLSFFHDLIMHACRNSNFILACDGGYQSGIAIIDTKGTYTNFEDDEVVRINNFIDQDGKGSNPTYILSILEDNNGKIWIGTTMGVFEISDPKTFDVKNPKFNRIKVPRNDGTNYADYLLGSDYIFSMTADNSNRKWIGTKESGLFLVSPNGDKIIENFTTENSPLPSNEIAAVMADKTSNKVYVGTRLGLLSYSSNSSPVAESFDNVYAYPNPVRPDYTGWITITGLMDNSLVKIADSQGNVIYQTTSEGGMATWDGCNVNGARVKTGVYYVFASAGGGIDGGSTSGAVTKILVVN